MSGPPPEIGADAGGGGPPSPAQIEMMKEMGIRSSFVKDLGMGIGPYVMGFVTDLALMGVLIGQIWHWASWIKQERWFIKIIVWWVGLCALASSAFLFAWFDYLFVDHYGKFAQFVDNKWFQWFPFIGQGLLLGCHIFNLERGYRLHHRKSWVLFAIVPLMLAATGMQIAIKVRTGRGSDYSGGSYAIRPYMLTYLSTLLATDISITAVIAWGLWKSQTGWRHTDILIKRIITFSWEAQLPPAIFALAMLTSYAHRADAFLGFFFIICYAKVSAVALMAVLNFRFSLRRDKSSKGFSTSGLSKRPHDPKSQSGFHVDNDDIPMVVRSPSEPEQSAPEVR